MTRKPQEPEEPNSLPEDAFHRHYGNPTSSHPNVTVLHREQFGDESLAAIFVQLANQRVISQDSTEYAGEPSDAYTIVATSLPVIRPRDMERGLLVYHPEPNPEAVYELREEPETTDDTRSEEVSVCIYDSVTPLSDVTPSTLEAETRSTTVTVRELCDKFTFLVQNVTLLPSSELRS